MKAYYHIIILILTILLPTKLSAATSKEKDSLVIHFPVRISDIDMSFHNNGTNIDAFVRRYHRRFGTIDPELLQIDIVAGASPEGTTILNERLALRRAQAVHRMLIDRLADKAPYITENVRPIGWQKFRQIIDESNEPWRKEVTDILDQTPDRPVGGWEIDPRERQLRKLRNGTVWPILLERYLHPLRSGVAAIVHWRDDVDTVVVRDTIIQHKESVEIRYVRDTIYKEVTVKQIVEAPPAPHCAGLALRTNVLYWGTLSPNLSVDLGLSCHWSAVLTAGFNIWKYPSYVNDRGKTVNPKFMHWLVMPEVRYWPRQHLERFFVGLHATYANYNVGGLKQFSALKNHRYDGWLAGGGVTAGWQWWLDRRHRWGVETSLGLGYLYLHYDDYPPCQCGELRSRVKKNYWGLTSIALSLTYRIK